jgi:adenine phosphoribosyltransferase
MTQRPTYRVEVAGVSRDLALFEVAPGVRIAILNILGDTELVQAASKQLGDRLAQYNPDLLITAEAKSIPLAYQLSLHMNLPYIVLRKSYKPYMGSALETETLSITTGKIQKLYMDEKDISLVADRRVALIDDVISTGSTIEAMQRLVALAKGQVVVEAAIFTEGDAGKIDKIIALGHLPVFTNGD